MTTLAALLLVAAALLAILYPLRPRAIVSAFRNHGFSCSLRFFWRRLRRLRHPVAGVAMAVTAERGSP